MGEYREALIAYNVFEGFFFLYASKNMNKTFLELTKLINNANYSFQRHICLNNHQAIKVINDLTCYSVKTQSKQTNKQTNKQTSKQAIKQASKQASKQTNKQTSKRTNKQADKQTNKQTKEKQNKYIKKIKLPQKIKGGKDASVRINILLQVFQSLKAKED